MSTDQSKHKRDSGCCAPALQLRLDPSAAQRLSDDLQLLAHPVRLQILDLLSQHDEPLCVCDLEGALPVKQPTVSHHLKLLREAGLLSCERRGLWAYYSIEQDALVALHRRIAGPLSLLETLGVLR